MICPGSGTAIEKDQPHKNSPYGYSKSYRCPICGEYRATTQNLLNSHKIPKGKMGLISRDCPQCNESKVIPEGDFLCADCRGQVGHEAKMIASQDGEAIICKMHFTSSKLDIQTGKDTITIERADLPLSVIEGFNTFLGKTNSA